MAQTFFDLPLKKHALEMNPNNLVVSDQHIRWGSKELRCIDIDKIRYGIMITKSYGVKAMTTYSINLQDRNSNKINIMMNKSFLIGKSSEDTYKLLTDALWQAVTGKIVQGYIDSLNEGRTVTFDKYLEMTPQGVKLRYWSWFKRKDATLDWNNVKFWYNNGNIIVCNKDKSSQSVSYSLQNEWNAVCLSAFLNHVLSDGKARKWALGEKI